MRVTPQVQINQTLRNIQRNNAELLRFQSQISSGLRLTRPSDDPIGAAEIVRNRAQTIRFDVNRENIRDAGFLIEASVDGMLDVRQLLTEATQITLEASSSSNVAASEQEVNEALAQQVDELLGTLLTVANTKLSDGRSLFGGTGTDRDPFVVTSADAAGRPLQIAYQGANDDARAIIARGQTVETFLAGDRVFGNVFDVLIDLRDSLRDTTLTADPRGQQLQNALAGLEQRVGGVLESVGQHAARAENLEALTSRLAGVQLEVERITASLESTDYSEAILGLQSQENLFQIGLAVAARINGLSLLPFLT
ncbi:MAG: hypothetical protein KY476_06015 [Planctomycetes bacterium]|nr:hypothetical protein [Planctomycetota bacterium]